MKKPLAQKPPVTMYKRIRRPKHPKQSTQELGQSSKISAKTSQEELNALQEQRREQRTDQTHGEDFIVRHPSGNPPPVLISKISDKNEEWDAAATLHSLGSSNRCNTQTSQKQQGLEVDVDVDLGKKNQEQHRDDFCDVSEKCTLGEIVVPHDECDFEEHRNDLSVTAKEKTVKGMQEAQIDVGVELDEQNPEQRTGLSFNLNSPAPEEAELGIQGLNTGAGGEEQNIEMGNAEHDQISGNDTEEIGESGEDEEEQICAEETEKEQSEEEVVVVQTTNRKKKIGDTKWKPKEKTTPVILQQRPATRSTFVSDLTKLVKKQHKKLNRLEEFHKCIWEYEEAKDFLIKQAWDPSYAELVKVWPEFPKEVFYEYNDDENEKEKSSDPEASEASMDADHDCQYGERCKFLHVNQQQPKPNPFGFGTQNALHIDSQSQNPIHLDLVFRTTRILDLNLIDSSLVKISGADFPQSMLAILQPLKSRIISLQHLIMCAQIQNLVSAKFMKILSTRNRFGRLLVMVIANKLER